MIHPLRRLQLIAFSFFSGLYETNRREELRRAREAFDQARTEAMLRHPSAVR